MSTYDEYCTEIMLGVGVTAWPGYCPALWEDPGADGDEEGGGTAGDEMC